MWINSFVFRFGKEKLNKNKFFFCDNSYLHASIYFPLLSYFVQLSNNKFVFL
jgi:hypothetical protein